MGWVELDFQISASEEKFSVPFLVTHENLDSPLIGVNVIEYFIKSEKLNRNAISSNIIGSQEGDVSALVNLVKNLTHDDSLCSVKISKKSVTISQRQTVKVTCRVNTGPLGKTTPVIFEPDEN